jgi:hypothetical protein
MARFSKIHWISQHASLTSEQQRLACEQLLLRFSKLARMFDLLKHTTLVLDSSAAIDLMSDETCRMLECEHAIVHLVDRDRVFVRPQTLRHPRLQLKRVATENAAAQRALQNATGMPWFVAHLCITRSWSCFNIRCVCVCDPIPLQV